MVHYDSVDQNLAGKSHSACIAYWNQTRAFHMGPSRGWADVGYSFMACAHGYVLEGRGLYREQAAQPGGNTTHYSVTLATGPRDLITPEQIDAVRWLRAWLMEDHGNAGKVLGHRDFIATSCPGEKAYGLVQDGTFTKAPGAAGGGMEDELIGLKEGDSGEKVVAVQRLISFAGFGSLLGSSGVDGDWGPATSAAMLALRHSVGSSVSNASSITGTAYAHLIQAVARKEAERAANGSGGGELPATASISGTVTLKGK